MSLQPACQLDTPHRHTGTYQQCHLQLIVSYVDSKPARKCSCGTLQLTDAKERGGIYLMTLIDLIVRNNPD
jgi:hypothetical protein